MADRFVWTAADGTVVDLTDEQSGYSILANGTRGLRSVEYGFTSVEYAGIDGSSVQSVKANANTPTLGLIVSATNQADFQARTRALVRAMRPKAGPGTLTVNRNDGSSRSLRCYVTGGMEGDESVDVTLPGRWWKLALKLLAPDPWWSGDPVSLDIGLGVGAPFFPIFPLNLAPSQVQGQFTVDLSDADAPSFPVWTITGPGTSLTLTNNTTGRSIVVNAALGAGEQMIIDTRPGLQSVRRGDGSNLMGALASDPALWPLVEGLNSVTASLAGAADASRISGIYQPRFSGI